jgi:hypothetical protein
MGNMLLLSPHCSDNSDVMGILFVLRLKRDEFGSLRIDMGILCSKSGF